MSFIEARLLDCLAIGSSGGPTWSTREVALTSGIIRRNATRSRPLNRYLILYQELGPGDWRQVVDAFNAARGASYGFRLRDPSLYSVTDEPLTTGTGSAQSVQLKITSTFGSESVERPIRKPNADIVIKSSGTPISATVDTTTGIATFTATNGQSVTWSGTFDVPVRFESDELPWEWNRARNELSLSTDVALVEVLDA
jgi:uncharacterized protein (TIGR02217 family)